ncbi:MAG: NAD(P)/FAD-dependent oxidoreductase [Nitrospirota bacterium]|nr:NAD(P)/FAD-dependent oxidoreductase [Nitrospirota bacterium]
MSYDCVIVGSGISGLTAATILARNGQRVALVEKAHRIAPVMRGFFRQGVYFDTGFHYTAGLGDGEILDRLFRYLGISSKLEKYPFVSDRFDVLRYSGEESEFSFPVGEDTLKNTLLSAFPRERSAIGKYLAMVDNACRAIPYMDLDAEFTPFGSFMGVHGPSLRESLDGLTSDEELKRLLSVHSLLYGVPDDEVPFFIHATIAGLYYKSAHGIKGGGLCLIRAFEECLGELGVDIFTGRAVRQIDLHPDGKLRGIILEDDEVLAANNCVSTIHPRAALSLVPPSTLRPAYRHRLEQLEETLSAFMLYAVCDSPATLLQGTNLFLSHREEQSVASGNCEIERRTIYLAGTAPYRNDPGARGFVAICPADQSSTARWVGSRRGERPPDYLEFKGEVMECMKHRIESCCPELKGRFRVLDGATPLTLSDFASNPWGGLYGVKHKVGQYNPMPTTRIPGFYLAGQSVTAPGILGSALSAFLTCGSILGHEQLRQGVKRCN